MYRAAFPIKKDLTVEQKFDTASLMERKINVSINLPKEHKQNVETQRLKTDVYEMKSFLDLKKQFKRQFE
jgi:hypothetical protein